ncbi:hypothetical protein Tco_0615980 [Tanacetum coccineum]
MAGDDTPPPDPPPTSADKLIPFSITNKWKKKPHRLLLIQSGAILMILSRCGSLDPYDARAINLDNELRSIKIEKMSINEYCTKIKSMADRIKNLGCVVSDKNLVIYAVNGLDSRFATLVEIIQHSKTLPTFETEQNMLLLKESSMNDQSGASTTFESSSWSPTILVAKNSSDNKGPIRDLTCTTASHVFGPPPIATRNSILVINTGHSIIPSPHRPLHHYNVLVTPNIMKNLIYVRQFTRDNDCTTEFDAFSFSVKDFLTRHILLRCDNSSDPYLVTKPSTIPSAFVSNSSST